MRAVFSPDKKFVASSNSDGSVTLWDVSIALPEPDPKDPDAPYQFGVWTKAVFTTYGPTPESAPISFSADGKEVYVLIHGKDIYPPPPLPGKVTKDANKFPISTSIVVVLGSSDGKELRRFDVVPAGDCLFCHDGKHLLSADRSKFYFWDLAGGKLIRTLDAEGGLSGFGILDISADGKRALGCDLNYLIGNKGKGEFPLREWDLANGKQFKLKHGDKALSLVWPGYWSDAESVLCLRDEDEVFWDARKGKVAPISPKLAKSLKPEGLLFYARKNGPLPMSPDGTLIFASDERSEILDARTGNVVAEFPVAFKSLTPHFSSDSKQLLLYGTSQGSPVLLLWNVADKRFERVLAYPGPTWPAELLTKKKK